MALTLIRKNNSDPVTAYQDAAMWYMMLGDGFFHGVYQSMNPTKSGDTLSISSGMLLYGGRQIEISNGTTYTIDLTGMTGTVYIMLQVTIGNDDSNSTVTIYAGSSNTTTSNGPISGAGTFRTALWKIDMSTGEITTIFSVLRAGEAKRANNLLSNGYISGVHFSTIFLSDMSGVKYARNCDKAAEARGFIGGDKNKVSSNLYMPNRGVYLMQEGVLISTSESVTLVPGSDTSFNFPNSATLSSAEGIISVVLNTTVIDNGGYWAERGYTFKCLGTLEFSINIPSRKVTIRNTGTSNYTFPNGIQMSCHCYGGAV